MLIIHWLVHGLMVWFGRRVAFRNQELILTIEALEAQPPVIQIVEVPAIAAVPTPQPPEIPPDFCINTNDPASIFNLCFAPLPKPVRYVVNRDIIRVIDRPVPAEVQTLPPWVTPVFLGLIMVVTVFIVIFQHWTRPQRRTSGYDSCQTCITTVDHYNRMIAPYRNTQAEIESVTKDCKELKAKILRDDRNRAVTMEKLKSEHKLALAKTTAKAKKHVDEAEKKEHELLKELIELKHELKNKTLLDSAEHANLKNKAASHTAKVQELEDQVARLQGELKLANDTSTRTIAESKKQAEDEKSRLQAERDELKQKYDETSAEITSLRDDHVALTLERSLHQLDVEQILKNKKQIASLESEIVQLKDSKKEQEKKQLDEANSKSSQIQEELTAAKTEQKRLEDNVAKLIKEKDELETQIRAEGAGKDKKTKQDLDNGPRDDHDELKTKHRRNDDDEDNNDDGHGPGGSGGAVKDQRIPQVVQKEKPNEAPRNDKQQGRTQPVDKSLEQPIQAGQTNIDNIQDAKVDNTLHKTANTAGSNAANLISTADPSTTADITSTYPPTATETSRPREPQEFFEIPEFLPALDEYGLQFPRLLRKPEHVRASFQPERTDPQKRLKQYNRLLLHSHMQKRHAHENQQKKTFSSLQFQKASTTAEGDSLFKLMYTEQLNYPKKATRTLTYAEYLKEKRLGPDQQGVVHASEMEGVPTGPRALTERSQAQPARPQPPQHPSQARPTMEEKNQSVSVPAVKSTVFGKAWTPDGDLPQAPSRPARNVSLQPFSEKNYSRTFAGPQGVPKTGPQPSALRSNTSNASNAPEWKLSSVIGELQQPAKEASTLKTSSKPKPKSVVIPALPALSAPIMAKPLPNKLVVASTPTSVPSKPQTPATRPAPSMMKSLTQTTKSTASKSTPPTTKDALPPTVSHSQSQDSKGFKPPTSSFSFNASTTPASTIPQPTEPPARSPEGVFRFHHAPPPTSSPVTNVSQPPTNLPSRRNTTHNPSRRGSRLGPRPGSRPPSQYGTTGYSSSIDQTNPWAEEKK